MRIERIEEFKISQEIHQIIHDLLSHCFPDYPKDRIYFKQVPDFRYLAWEKKQLIAHMAVEYRVINVADSPLRIFGIADLCVSANFQSRKIASQLISELESLANEQTVDFMVLVAEKHSLYKNNGFKLVDNTCRWLIVNQQKTLGIAHRKISDSLMIKPLGNKEWKEGVVDFLGPIF